MNQGWKAGIILLSHERVGVAKQTFRLQKTFEELSSMAKTLTKNGRPLIQTT